MRQMQKYYIAFAVIAFVCVGALAWHYALSRGSAGDQKKITDIVAIQLAVDTYAQDNGEAPDSLDQVKLDKKIESRLKDYEYSHNTDTFTICANFSTDASSDTYYGSESDPYYHGKGRQCFTSSLYLYNASDLPYSPDYNFDDLYNQDSTQFDSLYQ